MTNRYDLRNIENMQAETLSNIKKRKNNQLDEELKDFNHLAYSV